MVPGIIAIIMSLTIIGSAGAGLVNNIIYLYKIFIKFLFNNLKVYAPTVASGLKSM